MEHDQNKLAVPLTPLPVPDRTPRAEGWTVARQDAFLQALAACRCITDACRAVGMSRQSAYDLYQRPAARAFRASWDAALDCAIAQVEGGAWERSIKGVPRPIFYRGEQVSEYRHFDEPLTLFLLRYRRSHRYCEPSQRWVPPIPPGCEDDGPDPDEAIGSLEYHLDDLVDEAELPGGVSETSRACDGVNFVNFVGFGEAESVSLDGRRGPQGSAEQESAECPRSRGLGEGDCGGPLDVHDHPAPAPPHQGEGETR
jgi:hypothetical protein